MAMQPSDQPPSYQELLETKALRTVYKWHMISLYCPENLLFRERVEEYKRMWQKNADQQELAFRAQKIVRDFCMADSVMEVNIDEKSRAKIVTMAQNPSANMFDGPLVNVDRDISRSLQAFYVSDAFLTYWEHRVMVNALIEEPDVVSPGRRGRSATIGADASRDHVLKQVRDAFNTEDKVVLKRHFDITSSFTYKVHAGQEGPHVGFGVQRGSIFYFYNLQEEQVLKVHSAVLLGKSTAAEAEQADAADSQPDLIPEELDDGVAAAGCCGGGGGAAPAAAQPAKQIRNSVPPSDWYVRDAHGKVYGPIKQISMQLLFRYHVLPSSANVSTDQNKWKPLEAVPDVFAPSKRIETIDPTEVPTF